MVAQYLAVKSDNLTFVLLREVGLLQKTSVVLVRHETDFHALLLVRRLEAVFAGDTTSVGLRQLAQGKERSGQLLLPEREEEIALVLARIAAALASSMRRVPSALF